MGTFVLDLLILCLKVKVGQFSQIFYHEENDKAILNYFLK